MAARTSLSDGDKPLGGEGKRSKTGVVEVGDAILFLLLLLRGTGSLQLASRHEVAMDAEASRPDKEQSLSSHP